MLSVLALCRARGASAPPNPGDEAPPASGRLGALPTKWLEREAEAETEREWSKYALAIRCEFNTQGTH
eukprot:13041925-Alexandrium_andersonii.AAC.1